MTESDDNLQTANFGPDGLVVRVFRGPASARYLRVVAAFVIASLSHLWLADAAQPDWFTSNVVYVIGLVVLIAGRGAAGWALCGVALAIPLLFHRDQLTQSALLLVACGAATATLARKPPRTRQFLAACRGLMVVTYLFAAFHKLNRDFFDPLTGCATYGMVEVAEYFRLPATAFSALDDLHAPLAVATELAIPLLYLAGRRRLARVVSVAFHIPLTLVMAPAFVFVMAVGHAAWLTDDDAAHLREVWGRWWKLLVPIAVTLTSASLLAHGAMPEWTMIPREFALWLFFVWTIAALRGPPEQAVQRHGGFVSRLAVGVFVVNCLTPYLGIQFQHAGAMLSNLRIDRGCWNHYVIPESVRVTDDYIRFERVQFGEPGAIPEYEQTVLEQLWSPPQLRQMRRNWCRPEIRPFMLVGEFRGRKVEIQDLCDTSEPWPFEDDGVLGVEIFGDFLRFQKNLKRDCPQTCIH